MPLNQEHCVPYQGETQPISKADAQKYEAEVPSWTLHQKSIEREIKFKTFGDAMDFVNKVAQLAEKEGHHPDIYIFYNKVKLQLTTRIIGGLTLNDFILASRIDELLK
jgi:4a-hydroxytetrahydrobiopterin dehydratase